MKALRPTSVAALLVVALVLPSSLAPMATAGSPSPPAPVPRSPSPGAFFVENVGQFLNRDIRFSFSSASLAAGFVPGGVLLRIRAGDPGEASDSLVRLDFEGSSRVSPEGQVELAHRVHYFLASGSGGWGARNYREIVYRALYEGVDLRFMAEPDGLKYEFVLRAADRLDDVRLRFSGATGTRIDGSGILRVSTPSGEIRDAPPQANQGGRALACMFIEIEVGTIGFSCPAVDPGRPLLLDPLVYAAVLGGTGLDEARAVTLDSVGNAYVTGRTASADFPTTPGATFRGGTDVFVAKISPTGAILYATFLGGSDTEEGYAIAVDASGNAYLCGYTLSADFPVTPAAYSQRFEGGDGFAVKIGPAGDTLLYATFLGGTSFDEILAIAVAPDGGVVLVGETLSSDFPTTPGALDQGGNGGWDGFVTRLDPSGTRLGFSTLLGGRFFDAAHGVALDADGFVYVVGYTSSTNFPVTPGAFQELLAGGLDGFAAKLDPSGGGLVYATFLGGPGTDDARSLALAPGGSLFIAGETFSPGFPTTPGAFDDSPNGFSDVFLLALAPGGDAVAFGTLFGGSGFDEARSLALAPSGAVYIAGSSTSRDLPAADRGPDARVLGGSEDAFLAVFQGGSLPYAAYVGGRAFDEARGVAVDANGTAYLVGSTESSDFPSTVPSGGPGGGRNAFVVAVLPVGGSDPFLDFLRVFAILVSAAAATVVLVLFLWRRRRRGPEEAVPP